MKLAVGGKEYTIEFTFEAAHNKKCVDVCWNYFSGAYMMKGAAIDELGNESTVNKVATVDRMIDSMSDIPDMVITLLYAGLMEHHGVDSNDPVIITGKDARSIYKQFCKENPDSPLVSDMEMFAAFKSQMEEDGFFKRIGLTDFMEQAAKEAEQKKAPKKPQDHRKKVSPSGNQ